MSPVLDVHDLGRRVRDGRDVRSILRGLELRVERGELVRILGPSGSGKSTLLSLLAGFELPDSGCVSLFGHYLHTASEAARARLRRAHVSFLFQRFHLFDGLTVEANVVEVARLLGTSRNVARTKTHEVLERLGLASLAHVSAARLSGGEKQRVALARALVSDAELLLCDEPTSALDPEHANDVTSLLRDAVAAGKTVVCTTHDSRFAATGSTTYHLVGRTLVAA